MNGDDELRQTEVQELRLIYSQVMELAKEMSNVLTWYTTDIDAKDVLAKWRAFLESRGLHDKTK